MELFLGSSQRFSRGELLQPYLVINVTGLVKIGEILLVADLIIVNISM